jgi:hypothetical protein
VPSPREVIAERVPARQNRLVFDPRFQQAQRRSPRDLQRGDGRIGQAFAPKRVCTGRQQRPDAAEFVDQLLRQRLGVDARDGQRQQIFNQLVIVEALRPAVEQPLPQPGTVALARSRFIGLQGTLVHLRSPSEATGRALLL